ncbi:NADH dehydrogenase 1 beta subcomplex subunit 7 ndufb7 [Cladochytrium tenue]|nr:NADH dehydrogenase 1 beta subcomplex subunit 7 ndufb7 [Cladochytrium tenue]
MTGHDDTAPPVMRITQEELARERIPLGWRDYCSHLLPELNKCRRKNFYLPWHCEEQRVAWQNYMRRMRLADKKRRLEAAAKLAEDD